MEQYIDVITKSSLFEGIEPCDFMKMLNCLQGRFQTYNKHELIFLAESPVETVGLVLDGSVQVIHEDVDGKQNILTEIGQGGLFGEVFACAGIKKSPVTVMAAASAEILHLNYRKIITTCSSSCAFHHQLIENMLTLVARKNLMLNQKLEMLSKRTTRDRVMLFLRQYSRKVQAFDIPYSHEELAAYLCVERSALSAELSKMQRDGLIRYSRKHFELL